MNTEKQRTVWGEAARKALVGRTITRAAYPTQKQIDEYNLPGCGVMIELDNGATWMPFADDEGNGPGALVLVGAIMRVDELEKYPRHLPTL